MFVHTFKLTFCVNFFFIHAPVKARKKNAVNLVKFYKYFLDQNTHKMWEEDEHIGHDSRYTQTHLKFSNLSRP